MDPTVESIAFRIEAAEALGRPVPPPKGRLTYA